MYLSSVGISLFGERFNKVEISLLRWGDNCYLESGRPPEAELFYFYFLWPKGQEWGDWDGATIHTLVNSHFPFICIKRKEKKRKKPHTHTHTHPKGKIIYLFKWISDWPKIMIRFEFIFRQFGVGWVLFKVLFVNYLSIYCLTGKVHFMFLFTKLCLVMVHRPRVGFSICC